MRQIIYFLSITTITVTSCNFLNKNDALVSFIPGTYVRSVDNEFSTGKDTLSIGVFSKEGGVYRILHRAGYQRILDGKFTKRRSSEEIWTAIYNKEEGTLHETVRGKLISFNPEHKSLFVGASEYQKIEE